MGKSSCPFFTNINCHCPSFNRWIISKYYTLNPCNNSDSANATTTNSVVSAAALTTLLVVVALAESELLQGLSV